MTMATNDKLKNELANRSNGAVEKKSGQPKSINDLLISMNSEIQRALPNGMNADRLARIALTTLRTNAKLRNCDPLSFIGALMQSAQLGLEPNTGLGQAYLIPYGKEVQFQVSYKGLIDLALRSGMYTVIQAREVYANDDFRYEYGLNPDIYHVPNEDPEGEPVGYYALYKLQNGGFDFVYWSRKKIEKHAKQFSKSYNNGPWKSSFDAMAKKTVLKEVLKYAPKSIEVQKTIASDMTIKKEISEDMSEVLDVTDYNDQEQVDVVPDDAPPEGTIEGEIVSSEDDPFAKK